MRNAIKVLGLVSVLAMSACDGGEGGDSDQFVGTWRAISGSVTRICPGGAPSTEAVISDVVWISGGSSDLAAASVLTPCRLKANVTGATASGDPGPTCMQSDGADGSMMVTFTSYTFVISTNGRTATENSSGQVIHVDRGTAIACAFNESASYQRIGI
jgi:hypothetical protein